jgi:hypothetical protein
MILYFDIREYGYYDIDSVPFQEGVFHLRPYDFDSMPFPEGVFHLRRSPTCDIRSPGKCFMSAENWEGSDKEWIRHIVPRRQSSGGYIRKSAKFCDKSPDVITNQEDWSAAWRSYSEATSGNWLTNVDFRREMVLIPYLPDRSPGYPVEAIRVDKKGDLTFHPGPENPRVPNKCSILFLIINRAGIKSVGGKPLPPVSNQ